MPPAAQLISSPSSSGDIKKDEKVEMSKIAPSEYTNTSRLIYSGPCIVTTVHIAGDGGAADCQVYDGSNVKGNLKAHLEVTSGLSYTWRPGEGTDFDYGLYVAVGGTSAKVTVTYIPESRKAFI